MIGPRDFESFTVALSLLDIQQIAGNQHYESDTYTFAGLPWSVTATKKSVNKQEFLSMSVHCNEQSVSDQWTCKGSITVSVATQSEWSIFSTEFVRRFTLGAVEFNAENTTQIVDHLLPWAELVVKGSKWIQGGKLPVKIDITVDEVNGVLHKSINTFSRNEGVLTDVMLRVEDRPVHTNKALLSLYSPVLANIFANVGEAIPEDGIPIEDVKHEEFVEFLNVIYPTRKAINCKNVGFLLQLADKFDVYDVRAECERFLLYTGTVDVDCKLALAGWHNLQLLHAECVTRYTSMDAVKRLADRPEFGELPDRTKALLLEKLVSEARKAPSSEEQPVVNVFYYLLLMLAHILQLFFGRTARRFYLGTLILASNVVVLALIFHMAGLFLNFQADYLPPLLIEDLDDVVVKNNATL